jgi:P2X purinoceptor 3
MLCERLKNALCTYRTVAMVEIPNAVGISMLRFSVYVVVLTVVSVRVFILDKSYQVSETGVGSVHTKAKGVAVVRGAIMDATEIVRPPLEPNALFLTTNFLDTPGQRHSTCTSIDHKDACESDEQCAAGELSISRLGILTGRCTRLDGTRGCELQGWCPVEQDVDADNVLSDVRDFTIFVRSAINFPASNVSRDNMGNLTDGVYQPATKLEFGKNLFRVQDLLSMAGVEFEQVGCARGKGESAAGALLSGRRAASHDRLISRVAGGCKGCGAAGAV